METLKNTQRHNFESILIDLGYDINEVERYELEETQAVCWFKKPQRNHFSNFHTCTEPFNFRVPNLIEFYRIGIECLNKPIETKKMIIEKLITLINKP